MILMGVLSDYFAADSDAQAASAIDLEAGPGHPTAAFDAVDGKGIDPVVMMGTLQELLTGTPYSEIVRDPRSGKGPAIRDEGEQVVLTLTDGLQAALAEADPERLAPVAQSWSETEEFRGPIPPEEVAYVNTFLVDMSGLARRAQAKSRRLYCWICV